MSAKIQRLPILGTSDSGQLSALAVQCQSSSSSTDRTDREATTASVRAIYKSCSKPAPLIFWCDSPWEMVVSSIMVDILMRMNHEEREKLFASSFQMELETQQDTSWQQMWVNLRTQLQSPLFRGSRSGAGVGEKLFDRFHSSLEHLNLELSDELLHHSSEKFQKRLKENFSEGIKCDEEITLALKQTLVKRLTAHTCSDFWGQWEFANREAATHILQRQYFRSIKQGSFPKLILEDNAPFSITDFGGKQSISRANLMRSNLLMNTEQVLWSNGILQDLASHGLVRQHWSSRRWAKKLNAELTIWLALSKQSDCSIFFSNICFVCINTEKVASLVQPPKKTVAKSEPKSLREQQAGKKRSTKSKEADAEEEDLEGIKSLLIPQLKDDADHSTIPKPEQLKSWLDQNVVGQDEAKKILSVAVYNHYKRIKHALIGQTKTRVAKSNVVLIGPSGSGKTLLVQSLARYLSVPMIIGDATNLSQVGYYGANPDSLIKSLYFAANCNIHDTQKGIVYIDEIDKLRLPAMEGYRDISGRGVQEGLLKILEGKLVEFKGEHNEKVVVDTTNILFIAGGAFSQIEEIVQKRAKGYFGFGMKSLNDSNLNGESADALVEIFAEDLIKFGMIPELVGRLPIIAVLKELDCDALVKVITEPQDSLLNQFKELLAMENVELIVNADAARLIAEEAILNKTGVRGLRTMFEKIMLDVMYDVPSHPEKNQIVIDVQWVARYCRRVPRTS